MLKTDNYQFGRDGIIVFLKPMKLEEFRAAYKVCNAHAKKKKIRKVKDWAMTKIIG